MGCSKLKNLWYCGILLWSDREQGIAYPRFADVDNWCVTLSQFSLTITCLFLWPRQLSTAHTVSFLLALPSGCWDFGREIRPPLFLQALPQWFFSYLLGPFSAHLDLIQNAFWALCTFTCFSQSSRGHSMTCWSLSSSCQWCREREARSVRIS